MKVDPSRRKPVAVVGITVANNGGPCRCGDINKLDAFSPSGISNSEGGTRNDAVADNHFSIRVTTDVDICSGNDVKGAHLAHLVDFEANSKVSQLPPSPYHALGVSAPAPSARGYNPPHIT